MRVARGCALVLLVATGASAQIIQDKFFDSNGVRIRYLDQGSGEPVLLVHGYTRNVEANWIDTGVFLNLAKDHRVIAFDLRGHGKSGKPHDPAAYRANVVQDAVRLLDHLDIHRAHIVGYSLGAQIVGKLLTTNPDRFLTATLGAGSPYRGWTSETDERAKATAAELESDVPFRSLMLALTPADEPKPTEDDVRRRSGALAAENDVKAFAAYYRGGRRELYTTNEEVSTVRVPVLGLVGSLDANLAGMKQLQMLLPALKLVVIDGATHAGERAAPRRPEFVKAIREFMAAHRERSQ